MSVKIDSIVNDVIFRETMPGCQVLVARDGIIFLIRHMAVILIGPNSK